MFHNSKQHVIFEQVMESQSVGLEKSRTNLVATQRRELGSVEMSGSLSLIIH